MEIEYRNTLIDLVRFNLYHFPRAWSFRLVFALLTIMFGKDVIALDGSVAFKVVVLSVLVVGMYLFFVVSIGLFATLNYLPKQNKGIFTTHRVTLTDEGVEEETNVGLTKNIWSSIPKVVQSRKYIYVYVQQNMAHVIPKHAFQDTNQAHEFFQRAKSLHQAARAAV